MNKSSSDILSIFETHIPSCHAWLVFKVGSFEHMTAMQNGFLYMNSLAYFAKCVDEELEGLRGDPDEGILARILGGMHGRYFHEFTLSMGEGDNQKTFDVSRNTKLTVEVPDPANVMVFCFSAIADDDTGRIPGENNGELWLDKRLLKFGSHILWIRDAQQFSRRISEAIRNNPYLYNSRYFQGGYGLVEYIDLDNYCGNVGLFRKSKKYSWQREFRFVLGVRKEGLNAVGSLELQIGNISDITELLPLEAFLKSPLKLKRRIFKKLGDEYIDVTKERLTSR
jgi:hypothetical protein